MLKYDAIVVGLGTAGAIAAISLARYGLKVLGIEQGNMMGGTATQGAVLGYYAGTPGGVFEEIDKEVYSPNEIFIETDPQYPDFIHPEFKAYLLEKHAIEAGVEIRYNAVVYHVERVGDATKGIKWKDRDGLYSASCTFIVDSTGEADICALAGCETMRGRAYDGKCQPYSLCTLKVEDGYLKSYYIDNGYINPNNSKEFSDELLSVYTQPMFLREEYDASDFFSVTASQVGIREGRMIVGERLLTFEDFFKGQLSGEPLFYSFSNTDTHNREQAQETDLHIKWNLVAQLRKLAFSVPVPKEALIPRGVKGVLAAGRCISVDHDLSPCVRMKKDMQKCGEAVAALIYLAFKDNIDPRFVKYKELEPMLRKTGCLSEDNNIMSFGGAKGGGCIVTLYSPDKNKIISELASGLPGMGIIHAVNAGESISETLNENLSSDNENLCIHSAFALALRGELYDTSVLRDIILEARGLTDITNKTLIYRELTAIYLLGLLKDEGSLELLGKILSACKGHSSDINSIAYQYYSYASIAISKLECVMRNQL